MGGQEECWVGASKEEHGGGLHYSGVIVIISKSEGHMYFLFFFMSSHIKIFMNPSCIDWKNIILREYGASI